ncbi:MAG: aldehyde dehydrogenase family protein [Gemmatimonadaceae bacterium]
MPERARRMVRVAEILEAERTHFSRIMTLEMGKPVGAARDEAVKCARACLYYAENAESMLAPEEVATDAKRSYVAYEPLGVPDDDSPECFTRGFSVCSHRADAGHDRAGLAWRSGR